MQFLDFTSSMKQAYAYVKEIDSALIYLGKEISLRRPNSVSEN